MYWGTHKGWERSERYWDIWNSFRYYIKLKYTSYCQLFLLFFHFTLILLSIFISDVLSNIFNQIYSLVGTQVCFTLILLYLSEIAVIITSSCLLSQYFLRASILLYEKLLPKDCYRYHQKHCNHNLTLCIIIIIVVLLLFCMLALLSVSADSS